MAGLIKFNDEFEEGQVYFKWESSRIKANKNIISVTTGATGSGKSYVDLRRAELSYLKRFGEVFPVETHVCFSVAELLRLISSGKLRRGDVIILEEAGFNAGSQDWQSKITKIFNYLLQTFRSMNICLYMNLPVLSMLSKQARQLVHIRFETFGIDFENEIIKVKPLIHQLNQDTGKSYWKFIRIKYNGKVRKIERMKFGKPSDEIIKKYEIKKDKFLMDITSKFAEELEAKEKKELAKLERPTLTEAQKEVYELISSGKTTMEVAEIKKCSPQAVRGFIKAIRTKGYELIAKKKSQKQLSNTQ